VFHEDRWAAAFITVLGDTAGAGLDCLKALIPPVQSVSGALFGQTAARRLEQTLRDAAGRTAANDAAAEYAIRFITLLVEKNGFRHIDSLVRRIERRLDEQNGVLDVTVESAAPLDGDCAEDLRQQILERAGAAGITMRTRLVPELLGGYRLRIGGLCVDASLKGQLEQMSADLVAAAAAAD
jgi:F-type H+-transporting ATPase subunit delta